MFHSVNCGDHYAYVDRNINQLNYLGYSDSQWRQRGTTRSSIRTACVRTSSSSRAAAAGFEIVLETGRARDERLQELAAMKVHPQFASVPAAKLCVTTIDFIARKPA